MPALPIAQAICMLCQYKGQFCVSIVLLASCMGLTHCPNCPKEEAIVCMCNGLGSCTGPLLGAGMQGLANGWITLGGLITLGALNPGALPGLSNVIEGCLTLGLPHCGPNNSLCLSSVVPPGNS